MVIFDNGRSMDVTPKSSKILSGQKEGHLVVVRGNVGGRG